MDKNEKIEKLKTIQEAFRAMLPGIKNIPCDIGLINDAGIYISKLIRDAENDS